jgi:hypothetical protein
MNGATAMTQPQFYEVGQFVGYVDLIERAGEIEFLDVGFGKMVLCRDQPKLPGPRRARVCTRSAIGRSTLNPGAGYLTLASGRPRRRPFSAGTSLSRWT